MKRLMLAAALCLTAATPVLAQEPPAGHAQLRYDRGRPDTWRGRPEWADFRGARDGFWYAPGYGYTLVDRRQAAHAWARGDILPAADRARLVQEPAFYGLRPPPAGYRWIYFNGDLLLTQVTTGVVGDVVLNGY